MSNFVGRDFGMFTLSLNKIRVLFSVTYQIKLFLNKMEDHIMLLYMHRYYVNKYMCVNTNTGRQFCIFSFEINIPQNQMHGIL